MPPLRLPGTAQRSLLHLRKIRPLLMCVRNWSRDILYVPRGGPAISAISSVYGSGFAHRESRNGLPETFVGFREAKPSGDLSTALEMTGRFGICIMPILGRRPPGAVHSDLDPWAGGLILGQTVG